MPRLWAFMSTPWTMCNDCCRAYKSEKDFDQHRFWCKVTRMERLQSEVIDRKPAVTFNSRRGQIRINLTQQSTSKYICSICSKYFGFERALNVHGEKHESKYDPSCKRRKKSNDNEDDNNVVELIDIH